MLSKPVSPMDSGPGANAKLRIPGRMEKIAYTVPQGTARVGLIHGKPEKIFTVR